MGRRDSRRLLITGSMAVMRRAIRKGPPIGSWLAKMLAGKRRMLEATALANKLTRTVWALTTRKDVIEFHRWPHKHGVSGGHEPGCEKSERE